MKKVVSMFMALIMAFTLGPVVSVRAEDGKVEDGILAVIDVVESCVSHPKICAHGASYLIKNVLDEVVEPGFESVLKFLKNYNYAFIFKNALSDSAREKFAGDPEWADLVKLTSEDNVSFSQVCDGLKTLVKMVAANPSSNKETKEEL